MLASILAIALLAPGQALPQDTKYLAMISIQIGFATLDGPSPAPTPPGPQPAPNPAPGICANCKGKGHLGDGTIKLPCPACDGTGKVKAPDPPKHKPAVKPKPVQNPLAGTPESSGRWTHPGRIQDHLIADHGYTAAQLTGLTQGQMLYLHDAAHEATRGGAAVGTRRFRIFGR